MQKKNFFLAHHLFFNIVSFHNIEYLYIHIKILIHTWKQDIVTFKYFNLNLTLFSKYSIIKYEYIYIYLSQMIAKTLTLCIQEQFTW